MFHWRRLIPGERDEEMLWGAILGSCCLIAAGWIWLGLPTLLCPFHAITGVPCPTCGITRGFSSLLHGDLGSAFIFNPLGFSALVGLAIYLVYAVIVVVVRLPRLRWNPLSLRQKAIARIFVILLVSTNWCYLIYHERFIAALR